MHVDDPAAFADLSTSASAATKVYGPASRRRDPNWATCSSSSLAMTETWDLQLGERRVIVAGVTVDEVRLAAVCARYGIARLMIFGSVARGMADPSSDVDVLYELQPGRRQRPAAQR